MKDIISINYDMAKVNHVRADAQKAIQIFLAGDVGTSLTIFPQALNPFLKALESLCIWKGALVIPSADENNKPVYIIVKVDDNSLIGSVNISEG